MACAEVSLIVSATTSTPRKLPSQATHTHVWPADSAVLDERDQFAGASSPQVSARKFRRPTSTRVTVHEPLDPAAGRAGELGDLGERAARRRRPRRSWRRSGARRRAPRRRPGAAGARGRRRPPPAVHQGQSPAGDRPGLVQHDGVDASGLLQHLGTLDQDPELRAPSGAHQQGRGRGQTERAGAGDDQHRDGGGEGELGLPAGAELEPQRHQGDEQHRGHEDRADLVGQPLHLGLAGLGVGDDPRDLRQPGVRADPGRAHHQTSARVDRRAGHRVARARPRPAPTRR